MPAAQAASWQRLLPDARVATWPEAGHRVLEEIPEAVAAIAEFMR